MASSSSQKTIDMMLPVEKPNTNSSVQMMQSLVTIQDTMMKLQETMVKNHGDLKLDIQTLDTKMDSIHRQCKKMDKELNQSK